MRDWVSDWKRWTRAERILALLVAALLVALPLSIVVTGSGV